jgi:hypothetical protein
MTAADWLTIATAVGAAAVVAAAIIALIVAFKVNKWQGRAQYREGLNEERRRVYPKLIRLTDQMSGSVGNMTPGSSPDPVILDCYAQLWCCASPDLLHAVTELSKAWPDLKKVEEAIENVRVQVRWDLFGADGFEWGAGQKFDPKIENRNKITYGVLKIDKEHDRRERP